MNLVKEIRKKGTRSCFKALLSRFTGVVLTLLLLFLGFLALFQIDSSLGETYERTLSKNYNFWVELGDLTKGEVVDYKVKVNNSYKVDVLWMTYGEWKRYNATESFNYDTDRSELNITEVSRRISVPSDNDYILVVDNTGVPPGGAMPAGEVNFTLDVNIYESDSSCCFGLIHILYMLLPIRH